MTAVIARLFIRYVLGGVFGVLVASHVLDANDVALIMSDPDLEHLIAGLVGLAGVALVEAWYIIAKKMGWST